MRPIIRKDYSSLVHRLIEEDHYLDEKFNNAFLNGNNKEMKQCIKDMFKTHPDNEYSISLDAIVRELTVQDNVHMLKYIYNNYANCGIYPPSVLFIKLMDICVHYNSKKCLHFLLSKGLKFKDVNELVNSLLIDSQEGYGKNLITYILSYGYTVDISRKYILEAISNFNFKFIKEWFRIRKDYSINEHNHIYLKKALHIKAPLDISRGIDNDDIINKYLFYRLGYHVNYLIDLGSEYRFSSDYPLRISCAKGHLILTTYFLSLGCDHTLKNWWCWRMAVKNNHLHIIYELELYNSKRYRQLLVPYSMLMKYVIRTRNKNYEMVYEYLKEQNEKQQERVRKLILNNVNILYSDVVGIIVNYL